MALTYNQSTRLLDIKGTITTVLGVVYNIDGSDIMGYSITEQCAGDGFALGEAQAATYTLDLADPAHSYDPAELAGAQVHMQIGIDNGGGSYAYSDFGVWNISRPVISRQNSTISISGSDALENLFNAVWSDAAGNYPQTIGSLATAVCAAAGVTLLSSTFTNSTQSIAALPEWPENTTLRGIIGYIAACAGGFARITRGGKLEFVTYGGGTAQGTIDGDIFKTAETGEGVLFSFNCVQVRSAGEEEFTRYAVDGTKVDDATNTLQVDANPLYTATIANNVKTALSTFTSYAMSVEWVGDPNVRLGDSVTLEDTDGSTRDIIVNAQTLSFGGGLTATTECRLAADVSSSSGFYVNEGMVTIGGQINGAALKDLSVGNAAIQNAAIGSAKIQDAAITTAKINDLAVTYAKLASAAVGTLSADAITALTAKINAITAGTVDTDTLVAAYAHLFELVADNIQAGTVTADTLTAAMADLIVVQAAMGNFDFATVQNLVSNALTITQGVGDNVYITNLASQNGSFVNATVSHLVLKGSDNLYYDVTVGDGGEIQTAERAVSAAEILAGETSDGKGIVETTADIASLNAQNIQAVSGVFDSILTAALTAQKISAQEALIASATVPELSVTALKAIGDVLDISANQSMRFYVGQQIDDIVVGSRNYLRDSRALNAPEYGIDGNTKTVSGDVASFDDGNGSDALALTVNIEPVQDFNGYDHPWPAGGGKNLIENSVYDVPESSNSTAIWTGNLNGTYTISIDKRGITSVVYPNQMAGYVTVDGKTISLIYSTGYVTVSGNITNIRIYGSLAYARLVGTLRIQLESGSTATAWTPYSNICPITGWTGANIVVSPTQDAQDGTTHPIDWSSVAGTVYGGTLDVINGILSARPYYASYAGETLVGPWVSSMDAYAEGTTPTTGAQVVDLGGAPITYQLTPQTVQTLVGTNEIWADTGAVSVTYQTSATATVEQTTVYDGTLDDVLVLTNASDAAYRVISLPYDPDEPVMVSIWMRSASAQTVRVDALGQSFTVDVGTTWGRADMLVENPTGVNVDIMPLQDDPLQLYKGMLENATKASDWVPAVEDTDESISNAQAAADAAQETADDANEVAQTVSRWMVFDLDTGLEQGKPGSTYSTLIDDVGYHILQLGEKIASFYKRKLSTEEIRVGALTAPTAMVLRRSSDGGLIIVPEDNA